MGIEKRKVTETKQFDVDVQLRSKKPRDQGLIFQRSETIIC